MCPEEGSPEQHQASSVCKEFKIVEESKTDRMKLLVLCLVVLPAVIVGESTTIMKCQTCAYSNVEALNRNHGDKDCKDKAWVGKFTQDCGSADARDPWNCGIVKFHHPSGDFLYERKCVKSSVCSGGTVRYVINGDNTEASWDCCHDKDKCNHGNHLRNNGLLSAALLALSLLLYWA